MTDEYTVTAEMMDFVRAEVGAMERSRDFDVVLANFTRIHERFAEKFPTCTKPELLAAHACYEAVLERADREAQAAPGQPTPPDKEPPEPVEST